MIELYLLENLYAVYEHKTLTLAAEKLHLSQPSMSRSMQKLEGILGVSLFDRQKNRISLNKNGVLAAKYAKKILDSEKEMIESIRAFDLQNQTIPIGSCAPGPLYLLPSHISKLYPDTNVTSCMDTVENLIKGLKNYIFSLIILPKPVEDGKIFSAKFVTEKLNINLILNHFLANHEGISFKEVDGQNFIMYDKVGIWADIVRKNMPNSRFFTQNDLDAVGEIARSSNFSAFSSNISLNFEPSRLENRINIPFSDSDATITFYLCCLSKSRQKFENLFDSLYIFSKY